MKINFTLLSTFMTGGVRAVFEIANGLSQRGHQVTITSLEGDHTWFSLEAEVIYVDKPNFIKILNPLKRVKSREDLRYSSISPVLKKMGMGFEADIIKPLTMAIPDCDINVATWFLTAFAVYRSGKGIPYYFFQDFEEIVALLGPYYLRMFKESLYLPFNMITGSLWLKEWVKDNYDKDAVVSGYGIDHQNFQPHPSILEDVPGLKVMGIFRGFEYKGDQDLIDAMNMVVKDIPDATLIAVCNQETFRNLLGNDKSINFKYQFFESPDDLKLAQLYSSSDLFAFPSHIEGFGLPPLEAMACGTPVVTTDCLGVRDFVVDGENSILLPPKEPEALARAIVKVLKDPALAEQFRMEGLKTAARFTWERTAGIFEETFLKKGNSSNSLS